MIKHALIYAAVLWPAAAFADKAPPGFEWTLRDSQGWEAKWERVGTTGTMWDETTVAFRGTIRKEGQTHRYGKLNVHFSETGALFAVRNDTDLGHDDIIRTCTYLGQTLDKPGYKKTFGIFPTQYHLTGTYLCSDMDAFGTWTGEVR